MVIFVTDPGNGKQKVAPDGFILAYRAANSIEAHLLQGMLEKSGIPVRLEGEALTGGIGELPMDVVQVSLWVPQAFTRQAKALLHDYEQRAQAPQSAWQCPHCGEENDASFEVCWQCQHCREP